MNDFSFGLAPLHKLSQLFHWFSQPERPSFNRRYPQGRCTYPAVSLHKSTHRQRQTHHTLTLSHTLSHTHSLSLHHFRITCLCLATHPPVFTRTRSQLVCTQCPAITCHCTFHPHFLPPLPLLPHPTPNLTGCMTLLSLLPAAGS